MAWQLIYTSAPRLLEAGRTGFGTVARHRAVSGMLASTVERFSQFARLPGYDPRRLVHTYRTVTLGSSTFHVFSCLRDAGSDYSGRTNHIAHHLIAEAREIRALTSSGLTPADVLHGMAWLSSWNDPPRFLDPADEISLTSFTPAQSRAWATLTGHPSSARLLTTPAALKGVYVILPPAADALALFRESLQHAPQSGWQTSFTTCLDPNDEVGDFRWIGIPASSPLRVQTETSNRPVLDLTQPAQLPLPPEPEPAPHAAASVLAESPTPDQPYAPVPEQPSPAKVTLRSELPQRQQVAHAATAGSSGGSMSTMGGWDPQPRKKAGGKAKSGSQTLIYSLIIVGLIVLSVLGFAIWKVQNDKHDSENFQQQLTQAWAKWVAPGHLKQSHDKIAAQAALDEGRTMLAAHEAFFSQLQAAINKPGSVRELPLPADSMDEITDLQQAFTSWRQNDANFEQYWHTAVKPGSPLQLDALLEKLGDWQKKRKADWLILSSVKGLHQSDLHATLLAPLKKRLSETSLSDEESAKVESLNKLLGTDPEIARWLQLSNDLDVIGKNSQQAAVAAVQKDPSKFPAWLKDKAEKVGKRLAQNAPKPAPTADPTDKPGTGKQSGTPEAKKQNADSFEGSTPIYICLPKAGEDPVSVLKQQTFKLEPDMRLFVGSAWEASPDSGAAAGSVGALQKWLGGTENGDVKFRLNFNSLLTSMLGFSSAGQITHFPEAASTGPDGLRVLARTGDDQKVLFDFRFLTPEQKGVKPVFATTFPVDASNADTVTLAKLGAWLERLHFIGVPAPQYLLRLEGSSTEQKFYGLKLTPGESAATVEFPQASATPAAPAGNNTKELDNKIKELEDGIAKDNQDLADLEKFKGTEKIKEERRKMYTDGKARKELELQQVRQKKAEATATASSATPMSQIFLPVFFIASGEYTLLEKNSGNTPVCKLLITVMDKASNIKTAKP